MSAPTLDELRATYAALPERVRAEAAARLLLALSPVDEYGWQHGADGMQLHVHTSALLEDCTRLKPQRRTR